MTLSSTCYSTSQGQRGSARAAGRVGLDCPSDHQGKSRHRQLAAEQGTSLPPGPQSSRGSWRCRSPGGVLSHLSKQAVPCPRPRPRPAPAPPPPTSSPRSPVQVRAHLRSCLLSRRPGAERLRSTGLRRAVTLAAASSVKSCSLQRCQREKGRGAGSRVPPPLCHPPGDGAPPRAAGQAVGRRGHMICQPPLEGCSQSGPTDPQCKRRALPPLASQPSGRSCPPPWSPCRQGAYPQWGVTQLKS